MVILRSEKNPVIKPEDVEPSRDDFRVAGVFNCGVTRFKNEIILLLRVAENLSGENNGEIQVPHLDLKTGKISVKKFDKNNKSIDFSDPRFLRTVSGNYLTSISHLRIARSKNGIDFNIDGKPALFPENEYERYGLEDPRITCIEGKYYISYSAVSDITGITTCLASTSDFRSFERHGVIFLPDNKDVIIFPEKIKGKYYALSRPVSGEFDLKDMWISESDDLICWGSHTKLMGTRKGHWDSSRIGGGAVPFRTEDGWIEIYHGASENNRYCLGAVLLDYEEPRKVLSRSRVPLIEPEKDYELGGFFGGVVFTCGVLYEENRVKIYYGAADTSIAYAEARLSDIISGLE
jgi:beta-1,2-mannobiose phosphorylase / 1,2-beta-oligomannan phosphorylase